ncbi:MAG: hypothetical protein Kow00124_26120 [Anaerolineae bacterium]
MPDSAAAQPFGQRLRRVITAPRASYRRRRIMRRIYLLSVALLTIGMLVGIDRLTFSSPQPWIADPRQYMLSGKLTLSFVLVFTMQMIATWLISVRAARMAASGVPRAGGQLLRARLRVIWRSLRGEALLIVLLRLGVFGVAAVAAIYVYTGWFGRPISSEPGDLILQVIRRGSPLLIILPLALALIQSLVGPFLRVRCSTALGALAATYTADRPMRPWAGMAARLGAGLAFSLALLWGLTVVVLTYLTLTEPGSSFDALLRPLPLLRGLTDEAASLAAAAAGAALVIALQMAGQIVLAGVFTHRAERRPALPDPRHTEPFLSSVKG